MKSYQAPQTLLDNKIILVTGAGSGIGYEAAKSFAAHGATVILLGRSVKKLENIYDEIVELKYPKPAITPLNLTTASPDDYHDLAINIEKEFGRLDGLLHNAATLGNLTPIEHYDIKQWYTVLQTNLNARFLLTHATIPLLKKSEKASVIFTSSSTGRQGKAYWGAYAISTFGNEGLVQVLAEELENTNIRVNAINPGPTRTSMRAKAYPAENPDKVVLPTELMPHYLYLMGDESSEINGQSTDAQS